MTKTTPGPWIVDDRHIHPATGLAYPDGQEPETDVIVLVDTDQHPNGLLNETDKANLRLIAAAPDLLMACNEALNVFKVSIASEDSSVVFSPERGAFETLRNAVLKARGE